MKWMPIKNYENYLICEQGLVYSKRKDKFLKPYKNIFGVLYIELSSTIHGKKVDQLSRLVLDTFQTTDIETKRHAWHDDLQLENCSNPNLTRCTRSDRRRMFNEIRGKKRGVYASGGTGKKPFRVALRTLDGRVKTIGYFKNKWFAELRYIQAYKKEFKRPPY